MVSVCDDARANSNFEIIAFVGVSGRSQTHTRSTSPEETVNKDRTPTFIRAVVQCIPNSFKNCPVYEDLSKDSSENSYCSTIVVRVIIDILYGRMPRDWLLQFRECYGRPAT